MLANPENQPPFSYKDPKFLGALTLGEIGMYLLSKNDFPAGSNSSEIYNLLSLSVIVCSAIACLAFKLQEIRNLKNNTRE